MSNNTTRKPGETEAIFDDIIKILKKLCKMYDEGVSYAAVLIGTLLRTMLKDKGNTKSMLTQLGKKDSIQFLDSSTNKKVFSFWEFGDNISNLNICYDPDFYGGLLKKKISNLNGKPSLDFVPLLDSNRNAKWMPFGKWYETPVFESPTSMKMTRKDIIEIITDKDGGAHLDPTIPENYAEFREPTALHFKLNGKDAIFSQNPVYVSLRQIAHELLKSLSVAGLTSMEED